MPPRPRIPEIDWVKGLAILFVLLIHSEPIVDTAFHRYVANRAVPIFVVLFGVSSELWWSRRAGLSPLRITIEWYRSRFERLMIPLWGALAVWWALAVLLRADKPAPGVAAAMFLGYLPTIWTGWFVTLIVELVILFPLLRWVLNRLGDVACLVLAVVVMFVSYDRTYAVIAMVRGVLFGTAPRGGLISFFPFWIFPPAWFAHVIAGMILARRRPYPTRLDALLSIASLAVGAVVSAHAVQNRLRPSGLTPLLDLPLTVLLLHAAGAFRLVPPLARALAWCGKASWGLYLGQLLVCNGLGMLGVEPWRVPPAERWAYFGYLFAGAVFFVVAGGLVRKALYAVAAAVGRRLKGDSPAPGPSSA
jgi:peptidoglycan/LPS O-acetylase OafA/YrhL